MQKIVITGNIGAGKSTIIKIFQKHNVPLFDADKNITDIYNHNQSFKETLYAINPDFVKNDSISKPALIDYLQKNPDFINILEGLLYPLLGVKRQEFIDYHQKNNQKMVVFEVPLLFEKGLNHLYDCVILVYAPYEVRLKRALQRDNMSIEKFDFMNKRQMNYTDLLSRVDLAIDTTQAINIAESLITERFFH
jgi:dephospho-CoA kinase